MSYNGYLVEIGGQMGIEGLKLPMIDNVNIFVNGSYSVTNEDIIAREWDDLLGKHHISSYGERTTLKFTIKPRTEAQHNMIAFQLFGNPSVKSQINIKYFEPLTQMYITKYFKMENVPAISSAVTEDGFFYNETEVVFTEI